MISFAVAYLCHSYDKDHKECNPQYQGVSSFEKKTGKDAFTSLFLELDSHCGILKIGVKVEGLIAS